MKNSIDLINVLYEKGLIRKEKNVYFVEEAFKINSFMKMCFREKNPEKLKRYIFLLQKYLAGAVNFHFKGDKIVIEKLPKEESLDAQEIL